MSRFGFAFNPTNPQARDALERAQAWCTANGIEAWDAEADDGDRIATECVGSDLICVLGGDGTFLRAARGIGDSAAPTLGVNLGRVGFLAKVETVDLEQALSKVASGDFAIEDRFRIEATLLRADGERVRHACLNEVVVARGTRVRMIQVEVVARGTRVRMIQVEVEVSGSHLATWVSDGVVVATPTGSTAYSFSAGGSVLDPRLRNMIITSVAGYLSPLRSVVAGEDQVVRLSLRQAVSGATISIDGQWDLPMAVGEMVEVRALPVPLRMVELSGSTPFYDLLRTKASLLPY